MRSRRAFLGGSAALAAAARGEAAASLLLPASSRERLATGAEATGYGRASTFAEVLGVLAGLDRRGAPVYLDTLGTSAGGRPVPYAVVSRPRVASPAAAKALARPIVLLVAALHGNEADGTEALLAMVRDLCVAATKTLLDELVLIVVPVANPDGVEDLGPQAEHAPQQNGPERIGSLENAAGVDLEGDFVALASSEIRGLVDVVNRWQPDACVTFRTLGASFADYGATYAPALHPAAFFSGPCARDRVLPAVRVALAQTFGVTSFSAGHFGRGAPLPVPPVQRSDAYGWFPPDFRISHATNYFGVRGLVAVTAASNAHDSFGRRVLCARAFAETLLSFCADRHDVLGPVAGRFARPADGEIPLRAVLDEPAPQRSVTWEELALDAGPDREPGVPAGFKRSGSFASAVMPVYDRYAGTLFAPPIRGYLISPDLAPALAEVLAYHGIAHHLNRKAHDFTVRQFGDPSGTGGAWSDPVATTSEPGAMVVSSAQPTGTLASVVLEPESDDFLLASAAFVPLLRAGPVAPVSRIVFS